MSEGKKRDGVEFGVVTIINKEDKKQLFQPYIAIEVMGKPFVFHCDCAVDNEKSAGTLIQFVADVLMGNFGREDMQIVPGGEPSEILK